MSIIRLKELKEMSKEKLEEKIAEIKKELMKSRTQISSKQNPDKVGKIKEQKKIIARIKTILRLRGGK
jgi:large subunit ribosomal protein L29